LLRYAIPSYRLPLPLLHWELGLALAEGVAFHPGRRLGESLAWEELANYDAVFTAVGTWQPTPLHIGGAERISDGLALLEALRRGESPEIEGEVAVIGGGNTALDVARSLVRLGAAPTVYYRRRVEDMPAWEGEIREAREEGVQLRPLLAPAKVAPSPGGTLKLALQPMQVTDTPEGERARVVPAAGELLEVQVTAVFGATGATPDPSVGGLLRTDAALQPAGLHLRRVAPEGEWEERPPVFLGGDLVAERRTVVNAVASGKEAAFVIGALLEGREIGDGWRQASVGNKGAFSLNRAAGGDRSGRQQQVVGYDELATIYFSYKDRRPEPRVTLEERVEGFDEIRLRMSESMASRAAGRCFHCGLCDQCDNCFLFCPDMSVLHDLREGGRDINYDYCKGCGVCVVECPRNAMVLEEEPR
jgi:2-oxoacid:acceptor oxidoreductase delta subunit (pyruvate/2-ketoisovalerate family)